MTHAFPATATAEWRPEYAIGISEIDLQHRRLLDSLRRIEHLCDTPGDGAHAPLWRALEELNEYAAYHFLTEEALLEEHLASTPETARHLAAHRSYWSIIADFRSRHARREAGLAEALVAYLNRWWIGHILGTDRAMGEQLRQLGVR